MAKQQTSQKQTQLETNQGKGHQVEVTSSYDDYPLPDADELCRLKELDPNIIDWLKNRAEKEQEFRHEVTRDRNRIVEKNSKGERSINRLGLVCAFLIMMFFGGCSFWLLHEGKTLVGSAFTGVSILMAAAIFAGRKIPKPPQPSEPTPIKKK